MGGSPGHAQPWTARRRSWSSAPRATRVWASSTRRWPSGTRRWRRSARDFVSGRPGTSSNRYRKRHCDLSAVPLSVLYPGPGPAGGASTYRATSMRSCSPTRTSCPSAARSTRPRSESGIRGSSLSPMNLPNVARNVIAHELGHAIGLGHNADPTTLMRPTRVLPARPLPFRPGANVSPDRRRDAQSAQAVSRGLEAAIAVSHREPPTDRPERLVGDGPGAHG